VPISSAPPALPGAIQPRPSDAAWYFPAPKVKRWDPDKLLPSASRTLNTDAGLPWDALDFRHTFGSQLAQKGESLFKIATLMGNSPEICRRHYAALIPEAMADTVEFGPTQTRLPPAQQLRLIKRVNND